LRQLSERWFDLGVPWGPAGSVGFELASGWLVTTTASDLDIAIRASNPITVEHARFLWDRAKGLEARVDVRVETSSCGFSLEEFACASSGRILLRYPNGARLGHDPWQEQSSAAGNAL
jgi:phosphoribosyl-dephospho-CoA transferase